MVHQCVLEALWSHPRVCVRARSLSPPGARRSARSVAPCRSHPRGAVVGHLVVAHQHLVPTVASAEATFGLVHAVVARALVDRVVHRGAAAAELAEDDISGEFGDPPPSSSFCASGSG